VCFWALVLGLAASGWESCQRNEEQHSKPSCANPSNTIKPVTYLGDYPPTDCLGTNTTLPKNKRIFVVTDWSPSKDTNGSNLHTYRFDKLHPCDRCGGPDSGTVDALYVLDCESKGQCAPNTPLAEEKKEITLRKTL
jgi:hypothetical protein